jgi:electron-transferring-flavoprotein dehydrogenase
MNNHKKPIVQPRQAVRVAGVIAEEKGVMILPGFAGVRPAVGGRPVRGVRTGDKGVGPDGQPRDNFEPGIDITAKVTIIGEGPRGHLARKLIERRQLDANSNPMVYEVGCKEVIELPPGTISRASPSTASATRST